MSITEDAPAPPAPRRSPVRLPGPARRATPWWWLVVVSAVALVGVTAVMGAWWAASSETRIATYRVVGTLSSIALDLDDADVEIVGGATGAVEVQRTEEFAFGRPPTETRGVEDGVLRIESRCPDTVVGTCRASYRLAIRDNVDLEVQSSSGTVRVSALNGSARIETGSGSIAVDGFCGFRLSATSAAGDVRGAADCSADRMELRSAGGDVRAIVPPGRYRVDATSDRGSARVQGIVTSDDASFAVQAISGDGDVLVEGRR